MMLPLLYCWRLALITPMMLPLLYCWRLALGANLGGRWVLVLLELFLAGPFLLLGLPELLLAGLLVLLGFACVARGVDSLFQERQEFVTP